MQRRFDDAAEIVYIDADSEAADAAVVADIDARGLLYPVTIIDGVPVYDGAVSYPAILRQVTDRLAVAEA